MSQLCTKSAIQLFESQKKAGKTACNEIRVHKKGCSAGWYILPASSPSCEHSIFNDLLAKYLRTVGYPNACSALCMFLRTSFTVNIWEPTFSHYTEVTFVGNVLYTKNGLIYILQLAGR